MKSIQLMLLAIVIFSKFCYAQISEWRQANRTGVSPEMGLLKTWPAEGPTLLWSNLDLAKGNSSVSFGDNHLYITGTSDGNDILYAIDMSGKIVWQTIMGRAWNESYPESRATPTVEGNKVYTTSGFGDLACVDGVTGKIIWSYRASEINKGTYGRWGIAESLIIDGDKLYFTPGGPETMTIALKKTTGEVLWKSLSLNNRPGYVSPILVNHGGKKMLVNISQENIFAVDVSNGEILWKIPIDKPVGFNWDLILCVTPVYIDGMVYVTGGYNVGGLMVKLAEDGKSATVVWTDKVLDVHHGGVVVVNGNIYGSNWLNNGDGNWCCIDWKTGEKRWEEHWNCKGSIISAEGMLYIYDEKRGNVGLLNANPEKFDLVSSFQITQGVAGPSGHILLFTKESYT